MMKRFYRVPLTDPEPSVEQCIYIDFHRRTGRIQAEPLRWLLTEPLMIVSETSIFSQGDVVEIGPRLSMETAFSSNVRSIGASMGLPVRRAEQSLRYQRRGRSVEEVVAEKLDPMTQEVYPTPLSSFSMKTRLQSIFFIEILERGEEALREANRTLGLGMDEDDIVYYTQLFRGLRRNPTNLECLHLGNANSEHSRHAFFRGVQVLGEQKMGESLMDVVQRPWKTHPGNSLVAFHDNAGVLAGTRVSLLRPSRPGESSAYEEITIVQHISATAETHNHPTLVSPFQGAATGVGGRIRDSRAVGRGGFVHAGLSGYFVGNLHIPGFRIPGETVGGRKVRGQATPLQILIEGSNGVAAYGNEYGEPNIGGFVRTFGQRVDGSRLEALKPVLYSAGLGRVSAANLRKVDAEKGMFLVRIGGPALKVGVGGGSASSMIAGSNDGELDFKSVQRGDAQYENRTNRVIQACAELGEENPIESIHDQGAGGVLNAFSELMSPAGGTINIRRVTVGDRSMSVADIAVAEFQESYGLLVRPESLLRLQTICRREGVHCDVLGVITGSGLIVVTDSRKRTTPLKLPIAGTLTGLPQKQFVSKRVPRCLSPLAVPSALTLSEALRQVFLLPPVGSKRFLTRKKDRSVTGLVARQQCVGPNHVPLADAAVTADSFSGLTGAGTALGEQPIKMLLSPARGARMAVAEMLTNIASVLISDIKDIKIRANWMWAAKLPGEAARLYEAAVALSDLLVKLRAAIDGGKDSLSMAAKVLDDLVVTPGQLVIMGYAPVPDITRVVTPDFKGGGEIVLIDLGGGKNRLGGSAFAQALGQVGNDCPNIDDPDLLVRAFYVVQELIQRDLITAYHDRSDGGLATTLTEMCIGGNRGARIWTQKVTDPLALYFSEEAGMVIESPQQSRDRVRAVFAKHNVPFQKIGDTQGSDGRLRISQGKTILLDESVTELHTLWEATATALEMLQANPTVVAQEVESFASGKSVVYKLSYTPRRTCASNLRRPKVALLREEGTNGDREMAAAFMAAGLAPHDLNMDDLSSGRVPDLREFQVLVFPGGFAHADALGSARGWAGKILFNPRLQEIITEFRKREDTLVLGVCNGCQLMANLGLLPAPGLGESHEPRLLRNTSGRFESQFSAVRVNENNPSVFFRGMEGSVLGVWVAHGEGRFYFPDPLVAEYVGKKNLVPISYVGPDHNPTELYPYNPNGSQEGMAALCSPDGRFLAMMPHPERCFLPWQWPWMPETMRSGLEASPWLTMFQNAGKWCRKHS